MNAVLANNNDDDPCDMEQRVVEYWIESARRAGLNLDGFKQDASLAERIAWALATGLAIVAFYGRFSTKMQDSIRDQARACVQYAAEKKMYLPPEFCFHDEAEKGRRVHRAGLERLRLELRNAKIQALLVFKVSRLFRHPHQGYQFFQQELVDRNLRGISVTQNIDTLDEKTWKPLMTLHGMMDDLLLDAIADHVREGLKGLFERGYTVGAIPVGYRRVEVAGAPPTKLGKPRTMPGVDPEPAKLIVQHYEWIRDGMPVSHGLKRWVEAGGPCDPRSSTGQMSYQAYHHMLTNPAYTGRWEFGRKKNRWSSQLDSCQQVPQAEEKIVRRQVEELRIVSDELYFAVQQRLAAMETGPRGPRKTKKLELWDVVTDCFVCPHCKGARFYVAGANGGGMRCKNGNLCPHPSIVNRREAVLAVCDKLATHLRADRDLVGRVIGQAKSMGGADHDDLIKEITSIERKIRATTHKIDDLLELAGSGNDEDRAETKAKIHAVRSQRDQLHLQLARCQRALTASTATVTDETLASAMSNLEQVLRDAAAGGLGDEGVMRAAGIFRALTGGKIEVHVETRPGRDRTSVRGLFRLQLVEAVAESLGGMPPLPLVDHPTSVLSNGDMHQSDRQMIEVWLRQPPRIDQIAAEVRRLYEEEGLGFRVIAKQLKIGCGNIYQAYLRYYEMQGLPTPQRRPRGRQSRSPQV